MTHQPPDPSVPAPLSAAHAFVPGDVFRLDSKGRRMRACAICGFVGRGGGHRSMTTWTIRSGQMAATVAAPDQFAAWDTWRAQDRYQFGLVAVAIPNGDESRMVPVQTAALMRRWDRIHDAEQFDELARSKGLL